MQRQHYTQERKMQVLARYASSDEQLKDILADEEIPKSTFTQWLREYDKNTGNEYLAFTPKNFKTLVREKQQLQDVIAVLQESCCHPNAPLQEKLEEAENLYQKYNVHLVCKALNIDRGTFYNHINRNKRDNAWFFVRREKLRPVIEAVFDESNQTYGYRKITAILRSQGYCVSKEFVRDVMCEMGLISIKQYSKHIYSKDPHQCTNYVKQCFDVEEPNKVWVSDITYYKPKQTPFYICVIMDLFSRRIIAYSIGESNTAYLVKRTIKKAYEERYPFDKLTFHSDRGSNYKSQTIRKYLLELGITQSFSKPHTPHDNAVIESFFAQLKTEELYRWKNLPVRQMKESVAEYIEKYNSERPQLLLGNIPPAVYEANYYSNHKASSK